MIDLWQEIYGTIKRNKLRTFLTGFAVAWGIFMLIVLLGAGNGIIHAFTQNMMQTSLNTIEVWGGWVKNPYDGMQGSRRITLEDKDLEVTGSYFPDYVIAASGTLSQNDVSVSAGKEYVKVNMEGVYPNYTETQPIKLVEGRFINQLDLKERRKVMVLHKTSAEVLFGKTHTNPIGQYVNTDGIMYQVVGICNTENNNWNTSCYVPFSTLKVIYMKGKEIDEIQFTTKNLNSLADNEKFERAYQRALAPVHHYNPNDNVLWMYNHMADFMRTQTGFSVLRIAIWVIGIFTLLSGIVGVSNIMLITVKERTREFGIRKALGAKPSAILKLIIVESISITTLFGYIGMFAGIAVTEWMDKTFGNQVMDAEMFQATMFVNPTVDIGIAIQATVTLVIAGTLAGFFPAKKASGIRPIEALNAN